MRARKENQSYDFHSDAGRDEQVLRQERSEQDQGRQDNEPTRRQHEESGNFHSSTPSSLSELMRGKRKA
jgi:hypothetical protein